MRANPGDSLYSRPVQVSETPARLWLVEGAFRMARSLPDWHVHRQHQDHDLQARFAVAAAIRL